MLEQLFGSRTRVKLLRLFLTNPREEFFVRELTRKLDEHINSIRRELNQLEELGLLSVRDHQRKKYYSVNVQCNLYPELRALILKSRLTMEKKFIQKLQRAGHVEYLALMGYFVDEPDAVVDLFIVGDLPDKKLKKLLDDFTKQFGVELRYTLMNLPEYEYRRDVTDKFLFSLLHSQQIVMVDNLKKRVINVRTNQ